MKIRITDIPPSGLKLNDTIALSAINERLQEGSQSEVRFSTAPQAEVLVRPTPNGAEVKGKVKSRLNQACARCAEGVEREIEVDISYIFQHLSERDGNVPPSEMSQEIGMVYFEGEHIDLEPILQEALILELSLFWHPPLKADGSCTRCDMAPRKEQFGSTSGTVKFAELLKKAGVN